MTAPSDALGTTTHAPCPDYPGQWYNKGSLDCSCGARHTDFATDKQLWDDAYHIAWIGACNPRGVQHTIDQHLHAGFAADHPAMRAIQGHLDYLNGTSLGPTIADLEAVRNHHRG